MLPRAESYIWVLKHMLKGTDLESFGDYREISFMVVRVQTHTLKGTGDLNGEILH